MSPTPPKPTVSSALNFVVTRFVFAAHNPLISPAHPTVAQRNGQQLFSERYMHVRFLSIISINQSSALYDLLGARLTTLSEKNIKLSGHECTDWEHVGRY